MSIEEWSSTAANNASGVTGINWAEGQAPSTVNDSARELMAQIALWRDTLFTTGDVKPTYKTTADSGWVMLDDGTIGSASSGATTRANADTEDLFTLLWNNTLDANCAVSTGRGANAAADFAANKTIALPKLLGRDLAIAGAGSGLTSRALASALGAESKTIGTTNLPASGLSVSGTVNLGASDGSGSGSGDFRINDASLTSLNGGASLNTRANAGSSLSATTANMGSGTALDIMNPRGHLNAMVKL